jgi:hypothetical protein
MGQGRLNGHEALAAISERVEQLLKERVFRDLGFVEFLCEFPELAVTLTGIRAEFRVQADRFEQIHDGCRILRERPMVAVRFGPLDIPSTRWNDPWTLYFRVDWAGRDDHLEHDGPELVRKLRRALSPKRQREAQVRSSQDVWIPEDLEDVRWHDLKAQVALFVLQADLIVEPGSSEIADEFTGYLRTEFHLSADLVQSLLPSLLRRYWWPRGWRSWRAYLVTSIQFERLNARRTARPMPSTDEALLTVDAAERLSGRSRSSLYADLKENRIKAERDPKTGRLLIRRDLALQLSNEITTRKLVNWLVKRYQLNKDAARKRVQRWRKSGRRLEDLIQP